MMVVNWMLILDDFELKIMHMWDIISPFRAEALPIQGQVGSYGVSPEHAKELLHVVAVNFFIRKKRGRMKHSKWDSNCLSC